MKPVEAYEATAERVFDLFSAVTRARGVLLAQPDPVPPPQNPPPAPPPEPPAPPPQPPAPAPPTQHKLATIIPLEPAWLLCFEWDFDFGQAYDRKEDLAYTTGAPLKVRLVAGRMVNPIGQRVFASATYQILVDGVEVMTINPPDGAKVHDFTLPVGDRVQGYYRLRAEGLAGETCIDTWFYVDRGQPRVEMVPLFPHTYDLNSRGWTSFAWDWVEPKDQPITAQLPPREIRPFTALPTAKTLFERQLAPVSHGSVYRVMQTKGIPHTRRDQSYYWDTLIGAEHPPLPYIAGKRGEASFSMLTHIGRGRNDNLYPLTPWVWGRMDGDTHAVTWLLGYAHVGLPPDFSRLSTKADMRAAATKIGEWDGDEPLFHDGWGQCFLSPTTAEGAGPEIPNDGRDGKLERPHDGDVIGLIAGGSTNNLVQTIQSGKSHKAPVKGRILRKGADFWDVVNIPGTDLAVASERKAHRLVVINGRTGEEVETLLGNSKGDDYAYLGQNRVFRLRQPLAKVREQDIVLPEGLFWHEGWIYWASAAMGQVRAINWVTRQHKIVVAEGYLAGGVNFYKIAVEPDGQFMPKGSIFLSTWSITWRGRPIAYLPDGKGHAYASANDDEFKGPGLPKITVDYSSAPAVFGGRLIHSTSLDGLSELSQALPTDIFLDRARYERGKKIYRELWLDMTHGQRGWNRFGNRPAFGIHTDIDYYLEAQGHMKG